MAEAMPFHELLELAMRWDDSILQQIELRPRPDEDVWASVLSRKVQLE